jgi:hypothetical protein
MKNPGFRGNAIIMAVLAGGWLLATANVAMAFQGKCLLEVKGKKYLNGACSISMEADGGFQIGPPEKAPDSYFAIVSVSGKDVADGFWNEERGANHAHTPLGKLERKGACWRNKTANVCAWK